MGGLPIRRHPGEPVPRASREVPTPGRPQAASQAPHGADGLSGVRAYPENLVARAHGLTGVCGVEACAYDQHGPAGARLTQLPDRVRAVAAWGVQVQTHRVEPLCRGLAAGLGEGTAGSGQV
jgi:hypothetical protein